MAAKRRVKGNSKITKKPKKCVKNKGVSKTKRSTSSYRKRKKTLDLDLIMANDSAEQDLELRLKKLENVKDEQALKIMKKKLRIPNDKTPQVFYIEGVGDILDLCDTIVTDLNTGQRVDFDQVLNCDDQISNCDEEKIKKRLQAFGDFDGDDDVLQESVSENESLREDMSELESNDEVIESGSELSETCEDSDMDDEITETEKELCDDTSDEVPESLDSQNTDGLYGNQQDANPERALATLKGSQKDGVQTDMLQRRMRMLLNKVAEQNISVIFTQITELLSEGSRRDNSEVLSEMMLNTCIPASHVLTDREMCVYMLLLALIHRHSGDDYGFDYIRGAVNVFSDVLKSGVDLNSREKRRQNVVLSMAILLQFEVFAPKVIAELMAELSTDLNESNLECILIILRTCAFYIRKNHAVVMKDMLLFLKEKLKYCRNDLGSRAKFILENIVAIQNNNPLKLYGYDPTLMQDFTKLFRKISSGLPRSSGSVIMSDLIDYTNNDRRGLSGYAIVRDLDSSRAVVNANSDSKAQSWDPQMIRMAKKMNYKPQHKIDIFCSVMSSQGLDDAFSKIQELKLGGSFRNDVLYVILDCCLQGKEYNPFFFELSKKFCECHRTFKTSLQFALWDRIRAVQNTPQLTKKPLYFNIVQLFSRIVSSRVLPASVLKIFTFEDLKDNSNAISLLRAIFCNILQNNTKNTLTSIFAPLTKNIKSTDALRHSLEFFILKYLNPYEENANAQSSELKQHTLHVVKLLRNEETSLSYLPDNVSHFAVPD